MEVRRLILYYLDRVLIFFLGSFGFLASLIGQKETKNENNARVSVKGNLLTVRFVLNEREFVYYGERNIKHLDTSVLDPDGNEINFYPGFIPSIKAESLHLSYFRAIIADEEKKITSTRDIFSITKQL